MRRRKAVMAGVYGGNQRCGLYVSHYEYVNIPRFKHKKKPISMIKALDARDRIERNKRLSKNIMHMSVGGEVKTLKGLLSADLGEI